MTGTDHSYLSTLAGGLAHEVRNPLNAMDLNLQLLREELDELPGAVDRKDLLRKRVDRLRVEVQRLDNILNKFLDFTRGPELVCTLTAVADLLEDIAALVSEQALRQGIRIMKSFAPDVPRIAADTELLKQALLNLVLNSIQSMEEGGELMLRTQRQGKFVRIEIIDTGKGIPPDIAPRIFDAYFTTRRGGSGLGLALTRRYVEAHGGHIEFDTVVRQGTDFSVYLPLPEPSK